MRLGYYMLLNPEAAVSTRARTSNYRSKGYDARQIRFCVFMNIFKYIVMHSINNDVSMKRRLARVQLLSVGISDTGKKSPASYLLTSTPTTLNCVILQGEKHKQSNHLNVPSKLNIPDEKSLWIFHLVVLHDISDECRVYLPAKVIPIPESLFFS